MPYKLVYFDEVKQDIKEAKDWYRMQTGETFCIGYQNSGSPS